jgi:hypothetical protein
MKKKLHYPTCIRFFVSQITITLMVAITNILFAQLPPAQGYIYLHKNATDESSSPDFTFNVTGTSLNRSYSLNDQHPTNFVRDLGATGNGGVYAITGNSTLYPEGYQVYYRGAGATAWSHISGLFATRIDGGPGNTHIHCNGLGQSYIYGSSGTATSLNTTTAVDVAYDKSATGRIFYVSSSGQVYYYTSGGWIAASLLSNSHRIDATPNGLLISTGGTNRTHVYRSNYNGTSVFDLGAPTGGTLEDVAVSDDGVVYALGHDGVVYRYSNGYNAGGTWNAEPSSRGSRSITGGIAGQVWAASGVGSTAAVVNSIWSRTSSGFWIDDEVVRTSGNNNSVVIPVTPGTYSVVENATSGWSLGSIDIYDPTNNTTADVTTSTATVNVAAGEVVHLVYRNFLIQSFPVANTCSESAYFEDFGSVNGTALGGPLVGQTSYHHLSSPQFMNDGFYMVASRTSQAAPGSTTIFGDYPDHTTGNGTGQMMLVNASYDQGEFFRRRFTNLLPGTQYSFSAWILNLNNAGIKPNVRFEVNNPADNANLSTLNTGDIITTGVWTQYQLQFTATQSSVDLVLRNNSIGGGGNDLALDDIRFGLATPNQPIVQSTGADCNSGTGTITVTAPLGSSVEYSIDGTNYQTSPLFTAVPAGNYSVTARYQNSFGCNSAATTVTIDQETAPAIGAISGTTDPCSSGTTGSMYTYTHSTPGGVWSVSPASLATINPTTGVLTTIPGASGTAVVTYSVTTGVCVSTANLNVSVSPTSCTPMPVTLTTFTARKADANSAILNWVTTEETNSESFEIQHSNKGKIWNLVSVVAAKGESKQLVNYHYTHAQPANGENLYRLRMVDSDGTFAYSKIVSLSFDLDLQVVLYPNPAASLLKVKINGLTDWTKISDVKIFGLDGKTVLRSNKLTLGEINVSNLGVGTYVISISEKNGNVHNANFVIVR